MRRGGTKGGDADPPPLPRPPPPLPARAPKAPPPPLARRRAAVGRRGRERAPPPPRPFVLAPCRRVTPPLSSSGDTLRRTRACAPPGSDHCPRVCAPFDGPIDRPTMGGTHRSTSSIAYLSRPVMIDSAFPRIDPRGATPQAAGRPPPPRAGATDRSTRGWRGRSTCPPERGDAMRSFARAKKKMARRRAPSEAALKLFLICLSTRASSTHAATSLNHFPALGRAGPFSGACSWQALSAGGSIAAGPSHWQQKSRGVRAGRWGASQRRRTILARASPTPVDASRLTARALCPAASARGEGRGPRPRGAHMGAAQGSASSLNAGGG